MNRFKGATRRAQHCVWVKQHNLKTMTPSTSIPYTMGGRLLYGPSFLLTKCVFRHMTYTSNLLDANDITLQCGETYFFRGRKYFVEKRVIKVTLAEEGTTTSHITGVVNGKRPNIYRQDIDLIATARGGVKIDGTCTCPVNHNCKHVVAVCLAFIAQRQSDPSSLEPKDSMSPYLNWLKEFEQAGQPSATTKPKNEEWIAYLVKPGASIGELNVHLKITKLNKNGEPGKGRRVTHEHVSSSYSKAKYIQSIDREICQLINAQEYASSSWANRIPLSGPLGYQILTLLLKTNRVFWKDTQGSRLTLGESQVLNVDWEIDNKGERRPSLEIAHGQVLLTQPPLYIDANLGVIGPIDSGDFNGEQVRLLFAAPSIPDELTEKFSEHLTHDFPKLTLTPPTKVDITDIRDTAPTPTLILHREGQISQYFDYAGYQVQPDDDSDPATFKKGSKITRIHRAWEQEETANARLEKAGFQPTAPAVREHCLTYTDIFTLEGLDNSVLWFDLIEFVLPILTDQGWNVLQDEDFNLRFEDADDWQASIDDERSDNHWFEFRFDIEVDGRKIPLLPIISKLISERTIEDLPEMLIIPIEDQRFLKVPTSRLRPVIETLLELFEQHATNEHGALTLSRYDAPRLNQLATEGDTPWTGGQALREFGEKLDNFKGIADVPVPKSLKAELRPYQQEGLNWLQFLREYELGGILADDMGLGKTVQTLTHLLVEKEAGRLTQPVLIVAPTSLMGNWRREAERFTPDLKVLTLQGHSRKRRFSEITHHDLILTTYPLLPRDGKALSEHEYHSLILDEAQIIKNPRSQAAMFVRVINAKHRLCLTGTPMENHLGELWSLFDFLMPGFLGNAKMFTKIYRGPIEKHGDQARRMSLVKRINPFMLRRNKNEVATELPPKTEILRSVPLGEKQAALYESIRLTMEKKVRDSIASLGMGRSHITILDALLKLRQTCCDPRLLSLKQAERVQQSAKLDMLMEMLPEQLEEGRRILVFSQFTKMLGLIEKALTEQNIAYTTLTGQTRNRDAAIEEFTSGKVNLFLISLKAGGVGLNLTEADTVIHYDPWWNPAVETQATDRAHRIGQDKPVFVYKLITEHSVEEKILDMQEKKRALAEGIYNADAQQGEPKLSADDLKDLFTPLT